MSAGYEALRKGAAIAALQRDVLRMSGPEAATFLQGQLSQETTDLSDGSSVWGWVLEPSGRVDALVRLTRLAADDFLLDTDAGWGSVLQARLERFKLRTKFDLEALDWDALAVRGPRAESVDVPSGLLQIEASWPGLAGFDILGADLASLGRDVLSQAVPASAEDWEAARIEAGVPKMGAELTEKSIPNETGLVARTVSFTKGCYTGQELIIRIDSRGGHVPKMLRGLVSDTTMEPGLALSKAGKQVATVTSAAVSPALGWVGLAYVSRGAKPGDSLTSAAGATVRVEELPLVS